MQDRFYINCPIKNFFFKKNGGKKIISCQNHLAESGICFYSDIDLLFSFGNEKELKNLEFLEAGLTAQSQWALSQWREDIILKIKKT